MKKIKYLLTFLIALCFLPNMVKASQDVYYKPYKVGDEIIVTLDKDGKVKGKFRVIAASKEGNEKNVPDDYVKGTADYQYVTAIYEGTIGSSIYATSEYTSLEDPKHEQSTAYVSLIYKAEDLGWINPEEIRLLSSEDVLGLMNAANSSNVIDSAVLKEKYSWLFLAKPYWMKSSILPYKTSCPAGETCIQSIISGAHSVTSDAVEVIAPISDELGLRPVIKIHKGFVEGGMICNCEDCGEEEKYCPNDSSISIQSCIDGGQSEEVCIQKLCPGTGKTENPKTGSYLPLFGIVIAGILASCVYASTKGRDYFKKIK